MTRGYACPCCGFLTLGEKPPGTFEICPVCRWEDDYAQFVHPDLAGGANRVSLNQARRNFGEFGAKSEDSMKRVRPPLQEEIPHEVTFQDVLRVLDRWEAGEIDAKDVLAFAEDPAILGPGWPDYPRTDKRSVLFAVLESLEMVYIQPTLRADVPALREFLVVGEESPCEAWNLIETYWANVDWKSRLDDLNAET